MLLRIRSLARPGSSALLRRRTTAKCTRTRVASTARAVTQRQSPAATPKSLRRSPAAKPAQYIKPEDHQEPERVRLASNDLNGERMQIYHCGALRAATVATIKATNLLVLAGTSGYCFWNGVSWLAPSLPAFAVLGQMLWTGAWAYISSPMVLAMWIKKPKSATRSAEAARAWLKDIPPETAIELRTFRVQAAQKTTAVMLKELRPYKSPWWRAANLQRVVIDREGRMIASPEGKAWWRPFLDWTAEPRNRFHVIANAQAETAEAVALRRVLQAVHKNAERDNTPR